MGVSKSLRREVMKANKRVLRKTILGFFLYPIVWFKRKKIVSLGPPQHLREGQKVPWYYWYGNCSEHVDGDPSKPIDMISCFYGDENWRKRKLIPRIFGKTYITSLTWNVFRNGAWNFRWKVGSKWSGPIKKDSIVIYKNTNINGVDLGKKWALRFRNKSFGGEQEVTFAYELSGAQGYRISSTIKRGRVYKNKMEGTGDGAVIFKRRRFKELE